MEMDTIFSVWKIEDALFWPEKVSHLKNGNENSLVLHLQYGKNYHAFYRRSGKYRRRAVGRENKESPEKRRTSGVL